MSFVILEAIQLRMLKTWLLFASLHYPAIPYSWKASSWSITLWAHLPIIRTCMYLAYVHFYMQFESSKLLGILYCHVFGGIVLLLHRATSTINRITYLPWSDSDLAELRKVTPLPQEFEDPNGLPQLSTKQRSNILNWMRPYDICDNPRMVHLISSFSIKQVSKSNPQVNVVPVY